MSDIDLDSQWDKLDLGPPPPGRRSDWKHIGKRLNKSQYCGWTVREVGDGKDQSQYQLTKIKAVVLAKDPGQVKFVRWDGLTFLAKHPRVDTRHKARLLKRHLIKTRKLTNHNSWRNQSEDGSY